MYSKQLLINLLNVYAIICCLLQKEAHWNCDFQNIEFTDYYQGTKTFTILCFTVYGSLPTFKWPQTKFKLFIYFVIFIQLRNLKPLLLLGKDLFISFLTRHGWQKSWWLPSLYPFTDPLTLPAISSEFFFSFFFLRQLCLRMDISLYLVFNEGLQLCAKQCSRNSLQKLIDCFRVWCRDLH